MNYGSKDIRVLKGLLRGEAPVVGSAQRLHLEMLGLAVDSADGLRITAKGTELAAAVQLFPEPVFVTTDEPWEAMSRWYASDALEGESEIGRDAPAVVTTQQDIGEGPCAAPATAG
ncbi:MAG: hypothetical protein HYZ40_14615 [Rhodospirillales bacterium]|nr:hypothetical protein [Rhodospirillales bacterium]